MNCPKCNNPMLCGCKSCRSRRKMPRFRSEKFVLKGDFIKCGYCRTVFHPDQLLDAEWEQMKH